MGRVSLDLEGVYIFDLAFLLGFGGRIFRLLLMHTCFTKIPNEKSIIKIIFSTLSFPSSHAFLL
jgi:hypothetical protein